MKIYLGKEGLSKSWQDNFPETVICKQIIDEEIICGGEARIAFVGQESGDEEKHISDLHFNGGKGDYWVHDCCAVAVYFCKECLEASALMNQS